MMNKKTIFFIAALCLMQGSLLHALTFNDLREFCSAAYGHAASAADCVSMQARKHFVISKRLLATAKGIAISIFKKRSSLEEPFAPISIESKSTPVDEVLLSESNKSQNDVGEEKTLITVEVNPLYGNTAGSFDVYLQ